MNDEGALQTLVLLDALTLLHNLVHMHLLQEQMQATCVLPLKPDSMQHTHKQIRVSHTVGLLEFLFSCPITFLLIIQALQHFVHQKI